MKRKLFRQKRAERTWLGFTLIEILIILALLGALALGLIATIDPFEQLKKGRDATNGDIAGNVYDAIVRTYAARGSYPWSSTITAAALNSSDGTNLVNSLIHVGELKNNFSELAGNRLSELYVTVSADGSTVSVCFEPESKSYKNSPQYTYNRGGQITDCGRETCYTCVGNNPEIAQAQNIENGTGGSSGGQGNPTPSALLSITSSPSPTGTPMPTVSPTPTPTILLTPTATPTTTQDADPVISKRILVIGFNPVENGVSYADKYFSSNMGGRTASQVEDEAFEYVRSKFSALSENHIQFTIVKKIQITSSVPYPDGYSYTIDTYKNCIWGTSGFNATACENRKWQFNYSLWLNTNQICKQMQDNNADEIWMLSLPYIMAYENFMIGPTSGFFINGPGYIDTSCTKHYAVVNGTYDRSDLPFHNYGHRIESTMNYLTTKWGSADKQKYWGDFAATNQYSGIKPTKPVCGNGHFPFNTISGYDYGNSTNKTGICPDWENFPNLQGTTETGGCSLWGCSDPGWQTYWLGALPHGAGEATLTSWTGKPFQFSRNWWEYILDPDKAIAKYQSIQ